MDAALQLGLPEGRLPLAEAAVLLATAPKSNSAHNAIIAAMQDMQRTLQQLVRCCHGDDRPDCPILDDLAAAAVPQASKGITAKAPIAAPGAVRAAGAKRAQSR